jgi:60 kDa SS-A/Ro ribonucleoprotein
MKFNFSLNGKSRDNRNYKLVRRSGTIDSIPQLSGVSQWDLYTASLVAFLQGVGQAARDRAFLRQRIKENDLEFVARLAVHLREKMDLKTLSFWLSAELASLYGNDERTGHLLLRLIHQPGEIPEWLDYYFRAAGVMTRRPPKTIRKALDTLFNRLDEFQFGRYNGDQQGRMRDALKRLRPKPADKARKTLFGRILRDQFSVRPTWEQEWQALYRHHYDSPGQRQFVLRDKWKQGISSFRIGYTALLDNLQPMLSAGVSGKVLKLAAEYLGNAVAVGRSGQSILHLLEVYRSLRKMDQGGAGMLSEALEQAALHIAWNRTDLGSGKTWVIATDVSNSMKHPVPGYPAVQRFDIGPLLAMVLKSRGEQVTTGIIGNTWKPIDLPPRPILGGTDQFCSREGEAGYALNAHLVVQDLIRKRQTVDKVMIFTDCQLWDNRPFNQGAGADLGSIWRAYRQIAPQAKLYLFDLAGYGIPPLEWRENDVFLVAGWHERIFDILQAIHHPSCDLVI